MKDGAVSPLTAYRRANWQEFPAHREVVSGLDRNERQVSSDFIVISIDHMSWHLA